jgi:alpha-amylase
MPAARYISKNNARERGVYAALIAGQKGQLYVRIGGSDDEWQASFSSYENYREYAHGAGWKVWVALPANPEVQQAPLKPAFEVPLYRSPEAIEVPDEWLH